MVAHCQIWNYLHLEMEGGEEEEEKEGKQAVSADPTWLPLNWGTEPFPSLTRHSDT